MLKSFSRKSLNRFHHLISPSVCTIYFTKSLSAAFPNKTFNIPSWIPKFNAPTSPFNLDPPTYNEITNVIRKVKPSGSPCPLDQISVISLIKRCPYLRVRVKRGNGKTERKKRKRKSGKKGKRRKSGKRVKGGKAEKRVKGGKAEKRVKGGKAGKRVKGGKKGKRRESGKKGKRRKKG